MSVLCTSLSWIGGGGVQVVSQCLESGFVDDKDIVLLGLGFPGPTKKKGQLRKVTVRLIDEHNMIISELKTRYPALPDVKFFRHTGGVSGVKADEVFGDKYFYKYWVRACDELGISGLDLYGGTRHTIVTALAKAVGEVGAKKASGHDTNAAFNRYSQYISLDKPGHKKARFLCWKRAFWTSPDSAGLTNGAPSFELPK